MTRIVIRWCSLLLLGVATMAYAEQISEQSLLMSLTHSGKVIKLEAAVVKNIPFRTPLTQYHLHIPLSPAVPENRTLYTGSFHDPLDVHTDDFSDPANPRGGRVTRNRATFVLSIPYLPQTKRIRLSLVLISVAAPYPTRA